MENEIILKELRMRNFMRNKNVTRKFEGITNIFGANKKGKTTNASALSWLLFGVDVYGNTDFDIKYAVNGISEKQIEVDVQGSFLNNDSEIEIGRTLVEDWVTKRGSNDKVFKGHTTKYMWNNINISQAEFNTRRDELINKEIFKLITSPSHFFSIKKIEDQRKTLLTLVDETPNDQILSELKDKTPALEKLIAQDEDLELAKKSYAGKRKKIKDELVLIPAKINECDETKPAVQDWDQISKDIILKQDEITAIDSKIIDKNNVTVEFNKGRVKTQNGITEKQLALSKLKGELTKDIQAKEDELNGLIRTCNNSLRAIKSDIDSNNTDIAHYALDLDEVKKDKEDLLIEYKEKKESAFVFDESKTVCPTCKRDFDNAGELQNDIEKNFNTLKAKRLKEIIEQGKNLAEEIKTSELRLIRLTNKKDDLAKKYDFANKELKSLTEKLGELLKEDPLKDETYISLGTELYTLASNFEKETPPVVNDAELKRLKATTFKIIDDLKLMLNDKNEIQKLDERIVLHRENEKTMVQELLNLDKEIYAIEQFSHLKMQKLETEVNKLFSFIKFQLFETQINGGIKDVCNATFNGIRYVSLSGAEKVNAGLDIINAFCDKNKIYAPIFIDNRESATEIIPVKSQVINLFVSPEDKELRFEYK